MKPIPRIPSATVLVTGANGGLGEQFVEQALLRGAARVYAAARAPRSWADRRVVPIALDVTAPLSVESAARIASDTTIVINNAGIATVDSLLSGDGDKHRNVVETNLWGPLNVAREFAPVMISNGGGSLLNVLSTASWLHRLSSYSVSKAALWAATNSLRLELGPQGVRVCAVHLGFARTPMVAAMPTPPPHLEEPADVVKRTFDQFEAGQFEILADDRSREVRAALGQPLDVLYPELREDAFSAAARSGRTSQP